MTDEIKKCPNCGHVFKEGETYCPNCDLFVPLHEQDDVANDSKIKPFEENNTDKTVSDNEKINIPTFKYRKRIYHKHSKIIAENAELIPDEPEDKSVNEPEIIDKTNVIEETIKPTEPVVDEGASSTHINSEEIKENDADNSFIPIEDPVKPTKDVKITDEPEIDQSFDEVTFVDEPEQNQAIDDVTFEEELPNNHTIQNVTFEEQPSPEYEVPFEEPKNGNNNQPPKNNNNKKVKILTGVIILLVAAGGTYVYSIQKKQNELETTIKLTDSAEDAIQNLYVKNQGDVFLKKGISESDIKAAEDKVKELKGTDQYDRLDERVKTAVKTYTKLTAINDAFKTPVIEGNQINSDAYVKDDSKLTLEEIDPEVNGFDKLYNEAVKDANEQKDAIKTFNNTLEKLYKDGKVVKEPSKDVYNDAVKELGKIKDPEVKEEKQKIIDEVKKVIDEQEKEAEAKRKAEEEKQAQAAKAQTANNNTQSNNNNNSTTTPPATTGGRWGNRQDANIDLSNAAWAWNAGVQEKFISTVISRGYVVEGGYYLVPKFIENGEGYYDLYATTNSKLFPNSKPSEFPIYVVTVNAKTGWFRGNGPN